MSTRSQIGILNKDGSIDSIWCHWDGYPSNNGKILLEEYKTKKSIRKLISEGSIDSLNNPYVDRGAVSDTFHSKSVDEFMEIDGWQEYWYLFIEKKWFVCKNGSKFFFPLTKEMCTE